MGTDGSSLCIAPIHSMNRTIPAATETMVRILRAEYPALDRVLPAEDRQPTKALRTLLNQKGFQ